MGRSIRRFSWRHQVMAAALLLGCIYLLSPSPVAAQEQIDQALFERLRWARFELVRGRLEVHDIRRGQNRSITVNHHEIMVREHIDFRIHNSELLLHEEGQHYRASHLWLLFIEHPEDCQQHLVPLLQALRQDWHLGEWAETVETNLVRASLSPPAIDIDHLREKIQELGSGPYRQRRAADIAIRAMGQDVMGILAEIDTRGMNAEQRLRIRRICDSLAQPTADTPLSVTNWLQSSPSTWLCLMKHPDSTIRHSAHQRLAWLLHRPVPFNPEASPAIRERQIASVREDLVRR